MKAPIGYDEDYMVGPTIGNMKMIPIGDYVMRKKLYIYPWTGEKIDLYLSNGGTFAYDELLYFVDMHKLYNS